MEINNLPDRWEVKKMPQVVKWGSGGTPKATEKQYYDGGTIPWLIIGDLNDGIVTSSASKITELGLQNSSAKMIPAGTLLVAMYGSIGKLGITGIECCTNQAIAYAKELQGVTTKYMFYYMALMKSELISKGKGGTQKNISQTVLPALGAEFHVQFIQLCELKQEFTQNIGFMFTLGPFLLQGCPLCLQSFKACDQIIISAPVLALILRSGGIFPDAGFDHSGDDLHFP